MLSKYNENINFYFKKSILDGETRAEINVQRNPSAKIYLSRIFRYDIQKKCYH